ncbi:hypothetical protein [Coralloluteibacterium stylophorae]|uniref:Uncharacterized protein n=1 Tax=Coralloluteibacterium stylophorae TaxID=1776034 RepID=A0A8J8AYH1_9GAMM|nr:hypothetical protein [Coralloluteibacterium stylophorae]MBS7456519.1 hypothetical protein [Coralloluteibacterium stylophorae]
MTRACSLVLLAALAAPLHAQTPERPVRSDEAGAAERQRTAERCARLSRLQSVQARRPVPAECLDGNVRSYDREDLRRTGETDLGRSLERLDPSITTRRH